MPAGREVRLERFEPHDRRLVPVDLGRLGGPRSATCRSSAAATACGSRAEGATEVLYPVLIERGGHWDGTPGRGADRPPARRASSARTTATCPPAGAGRAATPRPPTACRATRVDRRLRDAPLPRDQRGVPRVPQRPLWRPGARRRRWPRARGSQLGHGVPTRASASPSAATRAGASVLVEDELGRPQGPELAGGADRLVRRARLRRWTAARTGLPVAPPRRARAREGRARRRRPPLPLGQPLRRHASPACSTARARAGRAPACGATRSTRAPTACAASRATRATGAATPGAARARAWWTAGSCSSPPTRRRPRLPRRRGGAWSSTREPQPVRRALRQPAGHPAHQHRRAAGALSQVSGELVM